MRGIVWIVSILREMTNSKIDILRSVTIVNTILRPTHKRHWSILWVHYFTGKYQSLHPLKHKALGVYIIVIPITASTTFKVETDLAVVCILKNPV